MWLHFSSHLDSFLKMPPQGSPELSRSLFIAWKILQKVPATEDMELMDLVKEVENPLGYGLESSNLAVGSRHHDRKWVLMDVDGN